MLNLFLAENAGMTSFLEVLAQFMTGMITQMSAIVDFVTETPMVLVCVVIAVAGFIIGIVKRFIPGL